MSDFLLGAFARSPILQYPDENLLRAAGMLKPEDRPTVPVRVTDDPASIFDRYRGYPDKELPEAFVIPGKDEIYINRRKDKPYKNLRRLAGNMGHEQTHIKGADELAARKKEIEILQGIGGEKKYIDAIRRTYGIK